jgi:hypothetical protein
MGVMVSEADPETALADEARRLRELRAVVDLTCAVLRQGGLSRREAVELAAAARARVLSLFPDKEGVFELVLAPRFARLIDEFVPPAARVLPFARPDRPTGRAGTSRGSP